MAGRTLERVARVRELLAHGAYGELIDQAASRLLPAGNPVFYVDAFVLVELRTPTAAPAALAPVLAGPAHMEALCRAHPERAALFRRRAREGQRCWVVEEDGHITARQWVIEDRDLYHTNAGLPFAPRARPSAWCHDIFVDASCRRRGHFAALTANAWRACGGGRLYAEIHHRNETSIRAHTRVGFQVVARVLVLSCLALKLYLIRGEDGERRIDGRTMWRVSHL
jgi:GNAT superfamily N-acetyltransferase